MSDRITALENRITFLEAKIQCLTDRLGTLSGAATNIWLKDAFLEHLREKYPTVTFFSKEVNEDWFVLDVSLLMNENFTPYHLKGMHNLLIAAYPFLTMFYEVEKPMSYYIAANALRYGYSGAALKEFLIEKELI